MAVVCAIIQIGVMWLFPPAFWLVLTRRLRVSWNYVLLGCATWLVAAPLLVGLPLAVTALVGATPLAWFVALAVTAGIAEETARYLVYRRNAALRDGRNWHVAVVAGAAHGGVESIVLGVQALLGLIVTFYTPEQLPSAFATPPSAWFYALGTVARVLIIIGHIGFALLVWRAVSQQRIGYYLAAVLSHIVIDLITFCQPILLPGYDWISYITLLTFCGGALWLIHQSRPLPEASATNVRAPAAGQPEQIA